MLHQIYSRTTTTTNISSRSITDGKTKESATRISSSRIHSYLKSRGKIASLLFPLREAQIYAKESKRLAQASLRLVKTLKTTAIVRIIDLLPLRTCLLNKRNRHPNLTLTETKSFAPLLVTAAQIAFSATMTRSIISS